MPYEANKVLSGLIEFHNYIHSTNFALAAFTSRGSVGRGGGASCSRRSSRHLFENLEVSRDLAIAGSAVSLVSGSFG